MGACLVVDDQVDGAANGVVRQRAHVQRLVHNALHNRVKARQIKPPPDLVKVRQEVSN